MGEVGIISVLGDGGAQISCEDIYKDVMEVPLHPLQFRELCAQFSYRATLATRIPKLISVQDIPHKIIQLPLGGYSLKPLFEEWENTIYSKYLAYYTGIPYEHLFQPPDKVRTWLRDPSGKVQYMDLNIYPYP
jgi:hypothetical protein